MSKRVKPSTLPGFMELLPKEQILFNHMIDTIRENYEKYGFLPIDTPVLEKSEVLLAKGGGETEKQVYQFMKGDTDISMRFDLTVPLARYVAEHFSELSFPFRRYHIAKVYRGERAQKGRFREFYQCDIDIIGNNKLSILNDAEIPAIIDSTFQDLGFKNFTIRINNRKILSGFYRSLGIKNFTDVLRVVDKLDKIGEENVIDELKKIGIDHEAVDEIVKFINIQGNQEEVISALENMKIEDELFLEGVNELKTINEYIQKFGVDKSRYAFDLSIARGLDYYTGTVYETTLNDYPEIGSVCSGGRYDNLASYYTSQHLPGVGISIGLSRLFYQLHEANIINAEDLSLVKCLVIPMIEDLDKPLELVDRLRNEDIACQIYMESTKLKKKFKYADDLNIPYVVIVGEEEIKEGKWSLRNMETGDQELFTTEEIISILKS